MLGVTCGWAWRRWAFLCRLRSREELQKPWVTPQLRGRAGKRELLRPKSFLPQLRNTTLEWLQDELWKTGWVTCKQHRCAMHRSPESNGKDGEMQRLSLTKAPVINRNEAENVSAFSCLLQTLRCFLNRGVSEQLGILVCFGNFHSLSRKSCSRNQAQTPAVSWGRSGNQWEIEELAASLSSKVSRCVVWPLAAHFGNCLLQGRILLFHERCLLACAEAPCLEGDFELWHLSCPSGPWFHDTAVVYPTPTECYASWSVNVNIFSQLLNPGTHIFPDIRVHLQIKKLSTCICKNHKSIYPWWT